MTSSGFSPTPRRASSIRLDRGPLARSRGRYGPTVLPKGRQEGADHRFRSRGKAYLQRQSSGLPLQLRQLGEACRLARQAVGRRDEFGDLARRARGSCMTAADSVSIAAERRSNRDWIPVPDFAGDRTSRPYRERYNGALAARIFRAARLDRAAVPACP